MQSLHLVFVGWALAVAAPSSTPAALPHAIAMEVGNDPAVLGASVVRMDAGSPHGKLDPPEGSGFERLAASSAGPVKTVHPRHALTTSITVGRSDGQGTQLLRGPAAITEITAVTPGGGVVELWDSQDSACSDALAPRWATVSPNQPYLRQHLTPEGWFACATLKSTSRHPATVILTTGVTPGTLQKVGSR